ncbi:Hypothetical predicted protein [Marmota monax]|uniref:Uncharacterized protein n=1 Tax=Marmota monax TaxID=9995 RepID=A0A5E4BRE9_MARMO|nr:hypothetical protein GHT09_005708 [Marmota monax]VTJ71469.1 Hypothetical predicted protein [Marmota monax]
MKYLFVLHLPDVTNVWQSAPTRALMMCKAGSPEPTSVYLMGPPAEAALTALGQGRRESFVPVPSLYPSLPPIHPVPPSPTLPCREAKAVQVHLEVRMDDLHGLSVGH